MARGVRKTALEKLTEQLREVRETIEAYESSLDTLRAQETELIQKMELERFREITAIMEEKSLSMDELKEWAMSHS